MKLKMESPTINIAASEHVLCFSSQQNVLGSCAVLKIKYLSNLLRREI
jgi:hypothetical protein